MKHYAEPGPHRATACGKVVPETKRTMVREEVTCTACRKGRGF
jgi:hypothetical protein